MQNRIRSIRQRRNLTLRELSEAVGTTPQSISRLETGNMTLSTEWLERFAAALNVHPVDLLDAPEERALNLLGTLMGDGRIAEGTSESFTLDFATETAVAVRLGFGDGIYAAGDILVGTRLPDDRRDAAFGADCLCETTDGKMLLRRCLADPAGGGASILAVPVGGVGGIINDAAIRWVAPLSLRINYPNP